MIIEVLCETTRLLFHVKFRTGCQNYQEVKQTNKRNGCSKKMPLLNEDNE